MKQAEFLNLDTKQAQWLDASLEHPNLVKVPEGAEIAVYPPFSKGVSFFKDGFKSYYFKSSNSWVKTTYNPENLKHWESWCVAWQRNSLQEKINETLSVLNANKAQLSILLGREKSYVKRLLAKDRNVTEKTKVAVIDQLEQLIRAHEYEQEAESSKCIGELTVTLSVDTKEVQDELKKAYALIDQANDNSITWQKKYEDQKNFIWVLLLGGIISWIVFLVFIYDLA